MPSPATFCEPMGGVPLCGKQVAPCSVRTVEHESHDWLLADRQVIEVGNAAWQLPSGWTHCNGVSSSEKRAAG